MSAKTRVAILGAGFISEIHLESYHRFVPDAQVVAVYSRTAARAQSLARKFGIAQWYDNLDYAITKSNCEVKL